MWRYFSRKFWLVMTHSWVEALWASIWDMRPLYPLFLFISCQFVSLTWYVRSDLNYGTKTGGKWVLKFFKSCQCFSSLARDSRMTRLEVGHFTRCVPELMMEGRGLGVRPRETPPAGPGAAVPSPLQSSCRVCSCPGMEMDFAVLGGLSGEEKHPPY